MRYGVARIEISFCSARFRTGWSGRLPRTKMMQCISIISAVRTTCGVDKARQQHGLVLDEREHIAHHIAAARHLDLFIQISLDQDFRFQNADDVSYLHELTTTLSPCFGAPVRGIR